MTTTTPDPRAGWIDAKASTPPIAEPYYFGKLSARCDVTDGAREGVAYYREADSVIPDDGEDELWCASGWTDEDGEDLDWKPTHWRPAAQ